MKYYWSKFLQFFMFWTNYHNFDNNMNSFNRFSIAFLFVDQEDVIKHAKYDGRSRSWVALVAEAPVSTILPREGGMRVTWHNS